MKLLLRSTEQASTRGVFVWVKEIRDLKNLRRITGLNKEIWHMV